ncbi:MULTISPECIES: IS66 family transposase [Sphingosinicellaceae]|uniref:IS66 family transposase n=1 Tax=Sphingosinicellaceae TaxID=2820280 RepID=UPI001C77D8FA|nr:MULTISPECIES: IS66 family transposase [Polymorphobacter]QYE33267.1 IS66 family transposase [Polymorphobacter sp. PAMC 29334]UAJ09775.1 IS66 family transposase [Polymorphobacter megasporae]
MLAAADLPDDPEVLRAMIVAANARTALLTAEVERINADVELRAIAQAEADGEIARLNSIIAAFMRHRFGPRSEKLDDDQFELVLEDLGIAIAKVEAKLDAASSAKARAEKQRRTNRGQLPAHLERVEQLIDVDSKQCACCGGDLHAIGEDVAERLDKVPASFRVLVTRRPRYACRSCEGEVVQAPAPPRIVEGGLPTDALVAQVLVSKYADHLPLYRQAQIYARQGVNLDRSTLADWTGRAAWWLTPLRNHLLAVLKRGPRLFADETTAPVLDPGRRRTKTGQIWAYARDDRPWGSADPPAVAFIYAPDRKSERPLAHLAGFSGILQVDGYAGYNKLGRRNDVALAFCWAHVRRKFFELAKADASPTATEALQLIKALYAVEDAIRGQSPDMRRSVRQEQSLPIIIALHRLLTARLGLVSAKSKLAEAIRYATTRWTGLTLFVDDGRVELDSNIVERAIRPIALNRKNALFAGSDDGGENWAVIASLIETAKINAVDPLAWLTDTLERLARGHSSQNLDQLMPWNFRS